MCVRAHQTGGDKSAVGLQLGQLGGKYAIPDKCVFEIVKETVVARETGTVLAPPRFIHSGNPMIDTLGRPYGFVSVPLVNCLGHRKVHSLSYKGNYIELPESDSDTSESESDEDGDGFFPPHGHLREKIAQAAYC